MTDVLHLKRKNITDDAFYFFREKTKRKQDKVAIKVVLKDETREIISRQSVSTKAEEYIFPVLIDGMTATEQHNKIGLFTKLVNKYLKKIGNTLEIKVKLTTITARHSFATQLKNKGVAMEFISEGMGHSDIKTTKNYLSSFEDAEQRRMTDLLIPAY